MYPKCGCTSMCRFCDYLTAKKDLKAEKQVAMLVIFTPGHLPDNAILAAGALGKDTVARVEAITFDPSKEQVGLKRSALKDKVSAGSVKGDSHGEEKSR